MELTRKPMWLGNALAVENKSKDILHVIRPALSAVPISLNAESHIPFLKERIF